MRLIDADALQIALIKEYDEVADLLEIVDNQPTAFDKEYFDYVMRLNIAYIDKIENTKDISKKKAIKYIKEHLKASTRRFVDWGDE